MAATTSVLALDVLAQFDRELAELVEHVETVVGATDLPALTSLRRKFDRLDGIESAVRERVTSCIANSALEWSDQIVQTRTLVVLADLALLCSAAEELPTGARLFGDAFPGVDALVAYVVRGIERITASLERERKLAQCAEPPSARTALTEVAFGKAACGLAAIGRDERLICALRAGARMPSLRFGVACRALLLSLGSPSDAAELILELPPIRSFWGRRADGT